MKKSIRWITIIWVSIGLISCEVKEELYLQNDGSGEYQYSVKSDISSILKGMKSEDSLSTENKDTTWYGKDFMKLAKQKLSSDNFNQHKAELQNAAKVLQHYTIQEYETEDVKGMVFSTSFNQLNELQDGNKILINYGLLDNLIKGDAKKDNESRNQFKKLTSQYNSTFNFTNNEFTRTYAAIDESTSINEEIDEEGQEYMDQMSSILKLKSIYHFPRRIVSCSYPNAQFSLDGKTMYIDQSILELFLRDKSYTLTVTLEEETP